MVWPVGRLKRGGPGTAPGGGLSTERRASRARVRGTTSCLEERAVKGPLSQPPKKRQDEEIPPYHVGHSAGNRPRYGWRLYDAGAAERLPAKGMARVPRTLPTTIPEPYRNGYVRHG